MGDWFVLGLLGLAALLWGVEYRRSIQLRQTIAAREELQSQTRALFEGSPLASWVFEYRTLRFLEVNDAALRQYGYTREEFCALTLKDLRVEGEWPTLTSLLSDPTAEHPMVHASHRRKDGRIIQVEVHSKPVVYQGRQARLALCEDVTARRATEQALRESEERFRQLAEHLPAVVYLVDTQTGSLLFISPAYERIWGRPRASLYANPYSFLDAVHEEDRERVTAAYQERLTRLEIEYRIIRPDGEEIWIEGVQFPIRRSDGTIYLVAGLAFDVSRRMRLETRLIETQKMESLGRLAGGVAHDFNNLLTVILSYAELLKDLTPGHPAEHELVSGLTEIETAGHRASSLTRQLLTFARRQVIDPRVVDINAQVVAAEPLIRHLVGRQIVVEIAPQALAPDVRLDANQLDQVVLNLVSNARDAMPEGGTLRVETTNVEGPVPGTDVPAGTFVALRVSDTGTGIPAEIRAQVFDPFFTTKPRGQGTGLGLSTSYGIVAQFGGFMELESQVGRGTTVTCYFPSATMAAERHPAVERDTPHAPASDRGTETVLVVEDEPMVRDVARATLERLGYVVTTATDGVDGLRAAEELGDRLDLVVTDVVMPQMGGWEMAEHLRKCRPDIKILFTSGYNEVIANAQGRVADDVEFLPKPYLPGVLAQRVRQVLDR